MKTALCKIILLSFLLIAGCAETPKQSRSELRETEISAYLRLESIKQALRDGSIKYGLKRKEVAGLLGKPDRIVQMKTASHYNEQWIYEDKSISPPKQYIFHFEDGTLTSWE